MYENHAVWLTETRHRFFEPFETV